MFDTAVVVSALVFTNCRLSWLRRHWREPSCMPLISLATAAELTRVLGYPKLRLSSAWRRELLGDYLPNCEIIQKTRRCKLVCRDTDDQPFLDLAETANADLLVSGDRDLLALAGKARFAIESPEAYHSRVFGSLDFWIHPEVAGDFTDSSFPLAALNLCICE